MNEGYENFSESSEAQVDFAKVLVLKITTINPVL